eukprot:gene34674-57491_t
MKPNPTRADLARTQRRGKNTTALALATMMVFGLWTGAPVPAQNRNAQQVTPTFVAAARERGA